MSLFKKMLRDIRINRAQFIAIFLMAFIGIYKLKDGYVADMDGKPDITLHFTQSGTVSKFYSIEGEDFNASDDSGVWLDKRFADARELKVGDNITFEFDNQSITKQIKGIGYSPEYIYETSPSSLTPDFSQMGFAYLSHNAYPGTLEYNTILVKYNMSDDDFNDKLDGSLSYLSLTRKEDHLSVSKFSDEMAQHKMIGDVFPIVFILVTFLTLLTTMTRIIARQRTQIGILKAVGFKDTSIMLHYISYAFLLHIQYLIFSPENIYQQVGIFYFHSKYYFYFLKYY